jgi:hypothetical protein
MRLCTLQGTLHGHDSDVHAQNCAQRRRQASEFEQGSHESDHPAGIGSAALDADESKEGQQEQHTDALDQTQPDEYDQAGCQVGRRYQLQESYDGPESCAGAQAVLVP